jgi:hypothetical protein
MIKFLQCELFTYLNMSADRLKYQCTQGDALKKALTWISNIV